MGAYYDEINHMARLFLILFLLSLFSCHHSISIKVQRLADTIAALKKEYDFSPLNQNDAYAFINNYYLPRLDLLITKRKIFIHPITGIDFKELFKEDSTKLEKEYSGDNLNKNPEVFFAKPPGLFDKNFTWDIKKLVNVSVINDYTLLNLVTRSDNDLNVDSFRVWKRKYGYGYMCVSYPQYNAYTKRLVIREWVENGSFCGTGREGKFWFTKTASGWKTESPGWSLSQSKIKNP